MFDGLANLQRVDFSRNKIADIGLHTFSQKAGLTALREIILNFNALASLEPWPLIRGQLVPGSNVQLEYNRIRFFTNQFGWIFRCGMKPKVAVTIDLKGNMVEHLSDVLVGWNITGMSANYSVSWVSSVNMDIS